MTHILLFLSWYQVLTAVLQKLFSCNMFLKHSSRFPTSTFVHIISPLFSLSAPWWPKSHPSSSQAPWPPTEWHIIILLSFAHITNKTSSSLEFRSPLYSLIAFVTPVHHIIIFLLNFTVLTVNLWEAANCVPQSFQQYLVLALRQLPKLPYVCF